MHYFLITAVKSELPSSIPTLVLVLASSTTHALAAVAMKALSWSAGAGSL